MQGGQQRVCTAFRVRKVAVLGAGKLGSRIALALSKNGFDVVTTARSEKSLRYLQELGLGALRDNKRAVENADAVVLAVKPGQFEQLAGEIGRLEDGKLVLSFMAGVSSELIRTKLGGDVYRCMTSIALNPIAVSGRQDRADDVLCVLSKIGDRVIWVEEDLLDPLTVLLGSGPAVVADLAEAFIEAGVYVGVPWDLAESITLDLLEVSAKVLREARRDDVVRLVATPGGTTITALAELGYVRTALSRAFERALARLRR